MKKTANVDAYIASFPPEIQMQLQQIRAVIREVAPSAEELISYGIPAYHLHGMLVWFAAHANFISLYPRGSGIEEFKNLRMILPVIKYPKEPSSFRRISHYRWS